MRFKNKRGEAASVAAILAAFIVLSIGALLVSEFEGITGLAVLGFDNVSKQSVDNELVLDFSQAESQMIYLDLENKDYTKAEMVVTGLELNGSYPLNPAIDVLNDGIIDWSSAGQFASTETIDFLSAMLPYLANCGSYPCNVPIKISAESAGRIRLSGLVLEYEEIEWNVTKINETMQNETLPVEDNVTEINETIEEAVEEEITEEVPEEKIERLVVAERVGIAFSGNGSGTPSDPFNISTCDELNETRDNLTAHYQLVADIDFSDAGCEEYTTGAGFEPVGKTTDWPSNAFTGTFDGNNHTITGLFINRSATNYVGLFGVTAGAEIKNVSLVDVNVTGDQRVGGLVGLNAGTISNSYSTGSVSGTSSVGGLVGYNSGTISNSYSTGSVSGTSSVGGFVGSNAGTISNSYSTGSVSGTSSVGGLVGDNTGTISNSHYDIDNVLINGAHFITIGGIYHTQYTDWIADKTLDIADYSDTLHYNSTMGYYEISTIDGLKDFLGFADDNYKFQLTDDIDLFSETNFYLPYLSVQEFDGNNKIISNLNITMSFASEVGFFGYVKSGEIKNISIENVNIKGKYYVGGLVGYNTGTITNSYSTGNMIGNEIVGGLVGYNTGTISNSYSTGNVSGTSRVGGLVGHNAGTISNSYSTGSVGGTSYVSGLVGHNAGGAITNSYWNNHTGNPDYCWTNSTGNFNDGCTAIQDNESYFYYSTNVPLSNWSFCSDGGNIWAIDSGESYPCLNWQYDTCVCHEVIPPNTTEFNTSYGSTNFSAVYDITNVTNLTLATHYGKIQFPADYGVDADGEDYDSDVEIGDGFISVNTSALDSTFNASVNLTINNVICPATIYFAAGTFIAKEDIISAGSVCNSSTDPNCTNINCVGGNLTFTVSHFTGFASAGTPNLTIWDETDSGMPYGNQTKCPNDQVKFFANYTNSTGAIDGANCTIWFNDTTNWDNMSWNSSGFYEYNRSFSSTGTFEWNVTCNKTDYDSLSANDSVLISSVPPWNGSGTEVDPFQITNCSELQNMTLNLTAYYILMRGINCSDTSNWNWNGSQYLGFEPIGNWSNQFTGTFDGQNHTITGLFINRSIIYVGLFGYTWTVEIKNVGLINVDITGDDRIGGLVGTNWGAISNSYSTGSVTGIDDLVGGLVGLNSGTISNSYSTGSVTGIDEWVGGLVGSNSGTISNSYSTSNVISGGNRVGGLVGQNLETITDSYSTGNVSGSLSIGGLVGYNWGGTVNNSYSTGNVNGATWVGGLVGYNDGGTINNSYSTGNVTYNYGTVGGLVGRNDGGTISNSYWNNHTGNPDECYGGGNTGCIAIQDNETYFYHSTNVPMSNWSFCNGAGTWAIDEGESHACLNWEYDTCACHEVLNTPPTAPNITYPNGGEVLTGLINITWNASTDAENDPITYYIAYSPDNGTSWNSINSTNATWYLWNTSDAGNGTLYLINVTPFDGTVNGTSDVSDAVFKLGQCNVPSGVHWTIENEVVVCENREINLGSGTYIYADADADVTFRNVTIPNDYFQARYNSTNTLDNVTIITRSGDFQHNSTSTLRNVSLFNLLLYSNVNNHNVTIDNLHQGTGINKIITGTSGYKVNMSDVSATRIYIYADATNSFNTISNSTIFTGTFYGSSTNTINNVTMTNAGSFYGSSTNTIDNTTINSGSFKGSSISTLRNVSFTSSLYFYSDVNDHNVTIDNLHPGTGINNIVTGTSGFKVNMSDVDVSTTDIYIYGSASNSHNTISNSTVYYGSFSSSSNNTLNNVTFSNNAFFQQTSTNTISGSTFNNRINLRDTTSVNFTNASSFVNQIYEIGNSAGDNPVIYGYINISDESVNTWTTGVNATRFYPVFVKNMTGGAVNNSYVNITNGTTLLWGGYTDESGYVEPNLTFTYSTKNEIYNITASWNPIVTDTIYFTKDTAIILQEPFIDIPPTVTLVNPAPGNISTTASVTFECNATDDNALVNISLYITNNTNQSFAFNSTTAVTGKSNSTNWTLSLANGNYTWNCLAYDNAAQSDWGINRSLEVAVVAPTICYCSDCTSCNNKLNDPSCEEVRLMAHITSQSGTCIENPPQFNNKTFDCQGHLINITRGPAYGIELHGKSGNTIKNCIFNEVEIGIVLNNSDNNIFSNVSIISKGEMGVDLYESDNNQFISFSVTPTKFVSGFGTLAVTSNLMGGFAVKCNNNSIIDSIIDCGGSGIGINVSGDASDFTIRNTNITNCSIGVQFGSETSGCTINNSMICENINWDIRDHNSNNGSNNICNMTDNWNDGGYVGCSWLCNGSQGQEIPPPPPDVVNISVSKTALTPTVNRSDIAEFSINITNTGDTNLTNIWLHDIFDGAELNFTNQSNCIVYNYSNMGGPGAYVNINVTNCTGVLIPNDSFVVYLNFTTLSPGNWTNGVNITAIDYLGNETYDYDNATVEILAPPPLPNINVTLITPADNEMNTIANVSFVYNISKLVAGGYHYNCTLVLNGTDNSTDSNNPIEVNDTQPSYLGEINITLSDGTYEWTIKCADVNVPEEIFWATENRTKIVSTIILPNATEFNTSYGSTNFSAVDIENVTNMTLATQYGKIQFPADYGVDADGEDYDSAVEIGDGFISVNTSALDSTFNTSANLTINNVLCPATVYFAAGTFTAKEDIISAENVCTSLTDPNCTNINCVGGTLTFTVSHFTGFASAGTANLTIWDETDPEMPYGGQIKVPNEQVKFFANYTNSTGTIENATCIINFTDSTDNVMDWNETGFYEHNRSFSSAGTFDWNVTCNKTGYDSLTANDTVHIINYTCYAAYNCLPGDTALFTLSNYTDAHASVNLTGPDAYNWVICCDGAEIKNNSCSGLYSETVLVLSNYTDAHVEQAGLGNYNWPVCIGTDEEFWCHYTDSCGATEYCIATISASTDAHVADCSRDPYSMHVCCSSTPYMIVEETLSPNKTTPSRNISVYGRINLSSGSDVEDNNISIYLNETRLWHNESLGLLVNYTTPNVTKTDGDGKYNYTFIAPGIAGIYPVKVNTTYIGISGENTKDLTVLAAALYATFDGLTTDFNSDPVPDITNVCFPILERTLYGKIQWHGCVNAEGADFDSHVNISHNFVRVNSSALDSSFNSSAEITLYGLTFIAPKVLIDRKDDGGWEICPVPECQIIDYTADGNLTFNVTHFTSYSARESSNLTIWDDTDPEGGSQAKGINDMIGFYANYTWTNGTAIDNLTGDCDIKFNVGGWGAYQDMTYDAISGLYGYNRTFSLKGIFEWNVSCTGVDDLTAADNVAITNNPPSLEMISLDPNRGSYNTLVNVTTINAVDINGDNLTLMCGDTTGNYNLCNSSAGQGQRSCVFNSTWSDDAVHQVYCVVNDSISNSMERNNQFYSDITPPVTLYINNVEGDPSPKYWDTIEDDKTLIQIVLNESGIRCRWNESDIPYDNMSANTECITQGSVASCNITPSVQINKTTVHISCQDEYGNDQNTSQNVDVVYGVDWTKPSVYTTNNGIINPPGYQVMFIETDIPAGTIVTTWYCNDTTGTCEPSVEIDNGSSVTFDQRGTWYLRWNASDEAGNINDTWQTIVLINNLLVVGQNNYRNLTDHIFAVNVSAYDVDTSQNLGCWLYHRVQGIGIYTAKLMNLTAGFAWNGTWSVNISEADGYSIANLIEMYVNCTDELEWADNLPSTTNMLPNLGPVFNLSNLIQNQTWDEDTNNTNITLIAHFYDPDGDDLNFTSTMPANIAVYIDNNTGVVKLVPDLNFNGIRNIIFYTFDAAGLSNSSNNVTLTVEPVLDFGETMYEDVVLTANLSGSGDGVVIGADNITLDCAGYSIIGDGTGFGINISGRTNVTVRNCVIENFMYGFKITNSNYTNISNTTAQGAVAGIWVDPSGLTIADGTFENSMYGLILTDTTDSLISSNLIRNNSVAGLLMNGSSYNNTVQDNIFNNNSYGIMLMPAAVSNLFENNTFDGNNVSMYLRDVFDNNITDTYLPIAGGMFVLDNSTAGMINYSESINITPMITIKDYVRISNNSIFVNSSAAPYLNKSAVLTLRGLTLPNAAIQIDRYDTGSWEFCFAPECQIIDYNSTTGVLIFNVSHFTRYRAVESTAPVISQIQCSNDSIIWINCSDIIYGYNLTHIRVNCTDEQQDIVKLNYTLYNLEDNVTYSNMTNYTNFQAGWYYFNTSYLIQDSGLWNLTITGIDETRLTNSSYVNWSIAWGSLETYLISGSMGVVKDRFFNFTAGLKCVGGECRDVNLTLDPESSMGTSEIIILNKKSYPDLGGNWTVRFNTAGVADLIITPINGSEFGEDLEFLELRCGDRILDGDYDGSRIFYKDYSCAETSYLTNKVLTTGEHTLEFRFGGDVEWGYNVVWYKEIVDSAGSVGRHSSIALDSSNRPHISYQKYYWPDGDLKYVRWDGSQWVKADGTPGTETVDSGGYLGLFTSIALDSSNHPHISYLDDTNDNLKYVRWDGSQWVKADGTPGTETVDSIGNVGWYTSIALDSSNHPHISYLDGTPNNNLKYVRWDGSQWVKADGTPGTETVDSIGNVGGFTSIALDSSNRPHISYIDNANYDLKYAHWTGSNWDIKTVDTVGDIDGRTSIALDSSNHPHITYYEWVNDDLKYVRWNGFQWVKADGTPGTETVDSAGEPYGGQISMALDSSNHPHISYRGYLNGYLRYAHWAGSWSLQPVDSVEVFDTSIALDSSNHPHISYYDVIYANLKYAYTCVCSAGPCCDGCNYKSDGSQPTGFTDDTDGFCTGTEGATDTSYVYTRDYYCSGSDAIEHHTDTLEDTCGTCKYCTDNDLSCNNYLCTNCGGQSVCYGGSCIDPDANSQTGKDICEGTVGNCYSYKHNYSDGFSFESGLSPYCCGDDSNEFYIVSGGYSACCNDSTDHVNPAGVCLEMSVKGIIPFNDPMAEPFYTITQNPYNCSTNMKAGEDCNVTWEINATGDLGTTWEFFVIGNSTDASNVSWKVNVTIVSDVHLSIWDDTDTMIKYIYEQINFYANYTNTSGAPINDTDVYCEVMFNPTGVWSSPVNMSYNDNSELYEYNRSFNHSGIFEWSVRCEGTTLGYGTVRVSSDVDVTANDITCFVYHNKSCPSGYTAIFRMSNRTNAHAELANVTPGDYNYTVCCNVSDGSDTLNTTCPKRPKYPDDYVLMLFNYTNAHVEEYPWSPQYYNVSVCLSADNGSINCIYNATCGGGYECVATISNHSNAHVADCITQPYPIKVCCGFAEPPIIVDMTNITFIEDGYNDSINLSNYVTDADSNVSDINWSYSGDTRNLTIYIDNVTKIINVSADPNWCGSRLITLIAIDPDGLEGYADTWVIVTCVNDIPTLTGITLNPSRGKNGSIVNVTSFNAYDIDVPYGDNLVLRCGSSDWQWDLCSSTPGLPERDCSFNSSWTDDSIHDVFCRVFDTSGNWSMLGMKPFRADNTPPVTLEINNVEGDATPKYWDTIEDDKTLIQIVLNETGISCRWDYNDTGYYSMNSSYECTILGSVASCNVTPSIQINETNVSISCVDAYGNEQNSSQNKDVIYGVDWTIPAVISSNDGAIHMPGYVVTLTITDVPLGTIVNVWWCNDTAGTCEPYVLFSGTNGTVYPITFNQEGTWYLRWNASDEAGNAYDKWETIVNIGPVVVFVGSSQYYDYPGHKFRVNVSAYDINKNSLNCTMHHRLSGVGAYTGKVMTLIDGVDYNGTWSVNISEADGYSPLDLIDMYVNCTNGVDYVTNAVSTYPLPNIQPTQPSVNLTPDSPLTLDDLICTITSASIDADTDSVNYTFEWYRNSVLNRTVLYTSSTSDILLSGNTSKGEEWNCTVIPYDGYENGSSSSDKVVIGNIAPTAPVVDITPPYPKVFEDLICNLTTPSIDVDNDAINYTYEWYRNGIFNRTFVTNLTSDILLSGNTSDGDEWNCTVTPFDGEDNGTAASDKVIIGNNPPVADAGPDQIWMGVSLPQLIQFNGSNSTDPDGDLLTFRWDNGLTGAEPTKLYSVSATYVVTLTVNDSEFFDSDRVIIRINDNSTIDDVSNLTNTTIINSTINNSIKINSIIDGSIIINSTNYNSNLTNVNETNSKINDSVVTNSTINDSIKIDSIIDGSIIINSTNYNSNISDTTERNSKINGSDVTNSTITNSTKVDSIIDDSTIINSTNYNSNISDTTERNSKINGSNVTDSTIDSSIKISCTITSSIINSSINYDSILSNTNESRSKINDSTIIDSTVINSTLINVTYINVTISNSIDENSIRVGGEGEIIIDPTREGNNIYYAPLRISDSRVKYSTVWVTNITNSWINNTKMYYSTFNNSVSQIFDPIDGKPTDNFSLAKFPILDSRFNNSKTFDSNITNSNITNSTVTSSDVKNSIVENNGLVSELGLTGLINFTVVDANVTNKYLYLGNITYQGDTYSQAVLGDWPLINIYAKCGDGACIAPNVPGLTNNYPECYYDCTACGDGICNNGETYATCPQDCPAPPAPPSAPPGAPLVLPRPSICGEEWVCSDWGACLPNGTQYRTCWDLNRCEELYSQRIVTYVNKSIKPVEVMSCVFVPVCFPNITLFGPVIANRTTAATDVYSYEFAVEPGDYILYIGNNFDAAAWIDLNGVEIATPADFKPGIPLIVKEVSLAASNKLTARIVSKPGSNIVLWIGELCGCIDGECIAGYECVEARCTPPPSCSDLIQNQEEEGIDCGGPCAPCVEIPVPVIKPTIIQGIVEFVREHILPFVKEIIGSFVSFIKETYWPFSKNVVVGGASVVKNIVKIMGGGVFYASRAVVEGISTVIGNFIAFVKESYIPWSLDLIKAGGAKLINVIGVMGKGLFYAGKIIVKGAVSAINSFVLFVKESYVPWSIDVIKTISGSVFDLIKQAGRGVISTTGAVGSFVKDAYLPWSVNVIKSTGLLAKDAVIGIGKGIASGIESGVIFVSESYWPFAKNIVNMSLTSIKTNWQVVVYALIGVVILGGIVYTAKNYEKMLFYKRYQAYKKHLEMEKRKAKLKEQRISKKKKKEGEKAVHEKMKKEYLQRLNAFLSSAVRKGMSKAEIKKMLVSQGWPKRFVDKYCELFFEKNKEIVESLKKEVKEVKGYGVLQKELEKIDKELGGLK